MITKRNMLVTQACAGVPWPLAVHVDVELTLIMHYCIVRAIDLGIVELVGCLYSLPAGLFMSSENEIEKGDVKG